MDIELIKEIKEWRRCWSQEKRSEYTIKKDEKKDPTQQRVGEVGAALGQPPKTQTSSSQKPGKRFQRAEGKEVSKGGYKGQNCKEAPR